jgi:hypothetical protein
MALAALATTTALGACFEWRAGPPPLPTPSTTVVAGRARIEMKDGRAYEVTRLRITGDSLYGDNMVTGDAPVTVATRDVSFIRSRHFSKKKTLIGTGITFLVMLLFSEPA